MPEPRMPTRASAKATLTLTVLVSADMNCLTLTTTCTKCFSRFAEETRSQVAFSGGKPRAHASGRTPTKDESHGKMPQTGRKAEERQTWAQHACRKRTGGSAGSAGTPHCNPEIPDVWKVKLQNDQKEFQSRQTKRSGRIIGQQWNWPSQTTIAHSIQCTQYHKLSDPAHNVSQRHAVLRMRQVPLQ